MYKYYLVDKSVVLVFNKIDCDYDGFIVEDIIERIKSLLGKLSLSLSFFFDFLI